MTEKTCRERYTRIDRNDGKWIAWLKIDHQSFAVCEPTNNNHAKWYAKMLAIALSRMIKGELANMRKP